MTWRRAPLFFLLLPGALVAQPEQVVAAAAEPPSQTGAPLGRLFFTPAEREALVAARGRGGSVAPLSEGSVPSAQAIPVPLLRLDGVVHRDSQPSLAFLNRRPVEDGQRLLEYQVFTGERGVTLVDGEGRRFQLLVGQILVRQEGRIVDPLPPRSLSSPR